MYAKTVKIYKGVDNVIQFDIQNADQKRLDLVTSAPVTGIRMNIMDIAGNALPNSPYVVYPHSSIKGIGVATIPSEDLELLDLQFLKYSVTATDTTGNHIPLYTDSRFSAVGSIELAASAIPTTRKPRVYDKFSGEINFFGNVINHSPAISTKFYEAIPVATMDFTIDYTAFIGNIYLEGTTDMTISVESFRNSTHIPVYSTTVAQSGSIIATGIDVSKYNYIRVSWAYPGISPFNTPVANPYGTVDKVTAIS